MWSSKHSTKNCVLVFEANGTWRRMTDGTVSRSFKNGIVLQLTVNGKCGICNSSMDGIISRSFADRRVRPTFKWQTTHRLDRRPVKSDDVLDARCGVLLTYHKSLLAGVRRERREMRSNVIYFFSSFLILLHRITDSHWFHPPREWNINNLEVNRQENSQLEVLDNRDVAVWQQYENWPSCVQVWRERCDVYVL